METLRSAVDPVDDLVLLTSALLPISASAAFSLFIEAQALESWLCEKANVEPKLGGQYELFWDPSDQANDSTIGCRITAFEPNRLLAFQWRSPRQFKQIANAADPLTHVVVAIAACENGSAVTLVHSGWRSTPEWVQAAEWQRTAWQYAFQALAARVTPASP